MPTVPHALAGKELRDQALWNVISDLIFVVRKDGVILEFHEPGDHEITLSTEGLVGKRITELLPTAMGLQAMHYIEKAARTGVPQKYCTEFQLPGRVRVFQARLAASGPQEVLALVRDVTDREQMERELLDISHREQMRIGQDLHDGLGQHLTGISFLCRALEKKLDARALPEAAEAGEVVRLVIQALSQTRNLARGLFPVELESKGLVAAFRQLAVNVETVFSITCVLACDETVIVDDQHVATHLFRLAQEAISNAVRHGKAKRVVVELKQQSSRGVLAIHDDGGGFSRDDAPSAGLGLKIMQYRAQKIGGTLMVESSPGTGTVVTCDFPQEAPSAAD
jgi:PAS domain S-box-containing protein